VADEKIARYVEMFSWKIRVITGKYEFYMRK